MNWINQWRDAGRRTSPEEGKQEQRPGCEAVAGWGVSSRGKTQMGLERLAGPCMTSSVWALTTEEPWKAQRCVLGRGTRRL